MTQTSCRCHRFPGHIIQHAFWLYARFTLSYRDVEELLAGRGLDISCGTVRRWVLKFGCSYASTIRRRQPRPHEQWHPDEMIVMIKGAKHCLWRAIDAEGKILDFLVQSRRNTTNGRPAPDAQACEEAGFRAYHLGHRQAQILCQGKERPRSEL